MSKQEWLATAAGWLSPVRIVVTGCQAAFSRYSIVRVVTTVSPIAFFTSLLFGIDVWTACRIAGLAVSSVHFISEGTGWLARKTKMDKIIPLAFVGLFWWVIGADMNRFREITTKILERSVGRRGDDDPEQQ